MYVEAWPTAAATAIAGQPLGSTDVTRLSPSELVALDALLARRQLPLRRADLPARQPAAARAAAREHIKPRLLGHWGTTPGLNFIYAHLNRVDPERDLDVIYVAGPGHGGPAMVANTYLEGTYSEVYPHIAQDETGMRRLFRQFSFPGGIPSHVAPETPGSIHEGGELGYALVARLRRGVRQSRSARRLRRRRRRGRDRPARHELALEQVPQSRSRRRRAADPAPERLQDRRTRPCWRASRDDELDALLRGYG